VPRSLHRPRASTDGKWTRKSNKTGVPLWTDCGSGNGPEKLLSGAIWLLNYPARLPRSFAGCGCVWRRKIVASFVVAILALVLSVNFVVTLMLTIRRDVASIRPVLVFTYRAEGWHVENLGNGPR
jgi:hypothetical protein